MDQEQARLTCTQLSALELEILQRKNELSSEEASTFHAQLIYYYENFLEQTTRWYKDNDLLLDTFCNVTYFVQKKVIQLEKILLLFFSPTYTISFTKSGLKVEDQRVTSSSELSSLLRKQEFFMKMIDSLEPKDYLNSIEAEVKSKQLDQFHEKFISNQSEIITLVNNDALLVEQIEISQKVLQKVLTFQTKLNEFISLIKAVTPALNTSSLMNEHFNQTEPPQVIVDFLDSQMKKQKYLIEQLELIESRNDIESAEAETLHGHLSQLHDAFVKNQSKIETYVSGSALDEQLRISGEILQKVITLQTKLKRIFDPIVSRSKDGSTSIDETQPKLSESFGYLDWLYGRQAALKNEVDKVIFSRGSCVGAPEEVKKLYEWFSLYQKKVEQLVSESPYDLKKAKENFDGFQKKFEEYRLQCNKYGLKAIDSFF